MNKSESAKSGSDAIVCPDKAATVNATTKRSSVVQVPVVDDRIYRTICLYVCFGVLVSELRLLYLYRHDFILGLEDFH